jgi:DNA-binding transcriptional LysR family regulator
MIGYSTFSLHRCQCTQRGASAPAHEFNVRQPIVTKRIKEVEDELQVTRFLSSIAGVRMAPAGEALVIEARRLLEGTTASLNVRARRRHLRYPAYKA